MDGEHAREVHPRPLRIGLIGPGRTRQGLGPFLARFAEEAGGHVFSVAGRDAERTRRAAADLAAGLGHAVSAHASIEELFADECPELVIIASPTGTHERALELALAHRCHILCEKPLVWGPGDSAERADWFVQDAFRLGLHLFVNTQWPETLPAYDALHPGVRERAHESFEMLLCPASDGWAKIPDSLPHPLSLLQATCGAGHREDDAQIEAVRFVQHDAHGRRVSVYFEWHTHGRRFDVHVELVPGVESPRPAAYAFDGHWACREITLADYAMAFRAGARRQPYVDPTRLLVRRVLDEIRKGPPAAPQHAAVQRIRMLETFESAWIEQFGRSKEQARSAGDAIQGGDGA